MQKNCFYTNIYLVKHILIHLIETYFLLCRNDRNFSTYFTAATQCHATLKQSINTAIVCLLSIVTLSVYCTQHGIRFRVLLSLYFS